MGAGVVVGRGRESFGLREGCGFDELMSEYGDERGRRGVGRRRKEYADRALRIDVEQKHDGLLIN